MRESKRKGRLQRIAEYDRPWVGRVGLALGLMLWLFVTAVAFAVGVAYGLAFLVVGGFLIFGEVWIERSRERHATFASIWRLSWSIGTGVTLLVIAVFKSEGWAAAVPAVFGAWMILTGLGLGALWLRERREDGER